MSILIKNGLVVNATGSVKADVLAEDGRIAAVGPDLAAEGASVIDASGCMVMPGFIDTHTHFDLNTGSAVTADDFASGTRAAVLGGTTAVLDFATQDRGGTLQAALDTWHGKAAGKGSSCNYGFHMAIADWNPAVEAELPAMLAQGVSSYKVYMVYDALKLDDGAIYAVLKAARRCGALVGAHCENWDVLRRMIAEVQSIGMTGPSGHPLSRPAAVEAEAVARYMRIAQLADAPCYVVHLSTRAGLAEALRARERGQTVYLETCPQYLYLTDERYNDPDGAKFVMSPPLRKQGDCAALRQAIEGEQADFIGTDHCSFTMAQKLEYGNDFTRIPNGGCGVGYRAQLLYNDVRAGRLTAERFVGLLSARAAELFGMRDRGRIAVGCAADIVVWQDADGRITCGDGVHNCDNTPFEGMETRGRARDVLLNGEHVVRNGRLELPGRGKYIPRDRCF